MRKNTLTLLGAVFGFCLIVIVVGSYVIVAQTAAVTGEWRADTAKQKDGKIYVQFERKSEKGGRNENGSNYDYSDFEGLNPSQTQSGPVNFRLVREAGTIDCQGTFTNGKGSGTFAFTPNRGFIEAMKTRGFDFEKTGKYGDIEDRLFTAATVNVTTKLADDLLSANFGPLGVDDLFKAAIFKIDSQFMSEMKATGFPDLKMEDLVKARIFKIDADYVRQVHEMGFEGKDFEGLVKFRIFKVTPEFLNQLKAEGFANVSSEEVVKCRIFNIDADFIHEAKAEDPNVTIEDLVQMKIGVRRSSK